MLWLPHWSSDHTTWRPYRGRRVDETSACLWSLQTTTQFSRSVARLLCSTSLSRSRRQRRLVRLSVGCSIVGACFRVAGRSAGRPAGRHWWTHCTWAGHPYHDWTDGRVGSSPPMSQVCPVCEGRRAALADSSSPYHPRPRFQRRRSYWNHRAGLDLSSELRSLSQEGSLLTKSSRKMPPRSWEEYYRVHAHNRFCAC